MAAGRRARACLGVLDEHAARGLGDAGFLRRLVEEGDAGRRGLLGDRRHARLLQFLHFRNVLFGVERALHAADAVGQALLHQRQFFGREVEGASDWLMSTPSE